MGMFWNVAPPATWAILTLSAILLLTGFVLLSHSLARIKGYGDRWSGVTGAGILESTVRVGVASVLAGAALWAVELDAPWWVVAAAGVPALAGIALEALARLRATAGRTP